MTYLKLRQAGQIVNDKRVERLCREANLQVRRGKANKVRPAERQPLLWLVAAKEVWFIEFASDRTAEESILKCLTILNGSTHEAVAIDIKRAISGVGVTRVMERLVARTVRAAEPD